MKSKKTRNFLRKTRHNRIRKIIIGTSEIPRLNIFKSSTHIYVQIIDDIKGETLVSASSLDKDLNIKNSGNVEASKIVGKSIAKKALSKKIKKVVFDRGGFLYHGRVKTLAETARENGLEF